MKYDHPEYEAKLDELATELTEQEEGDDPFTYSAVHPLDGKGWGFIEVRDCDGRFIGKLNA